MSRAIYALLFWLGWWAPLPAADLAVVEQLLSQGQSAQALAALDALPQSKAQQAEARFMRGVVLSELGQPDAAIALYESLVSDYPELPEPHNNLAVLYVQQGRLPEAQAALRKAIRTHPAYAIAHENLGDLYARLASEAYRKALVGDGSAPAPDAVLGVEAKLDLIKRLFVTPAAETAVTQPPTLSAETRLRQRLRAWARAWSGQQVATYLGFYSSGFEPEGGQSRTAWRAERQQRLTRPRFIQVGLSEIQLERNGDRASVQFWQHYQADHYQDVTRKRLEWALEGEQWRIVAERSLP